MLIEHLFSGEVMRHVWLSGIKRLEILKPQVDDGGYDLVLEANSVVRHVQLKATFKGSSVRRFNINTGLAPKPSGCVVCVHFEERTLALGPYYWFGDAPGRPLPSISEFPVAVAKHTKGNAQGVKNLRQNLRVVPLSVFLPISDIPQLVEKLFGGHASKQE